MPLQYPALSASEQYRRNHINKDKHNPIVDTVACKYMRQKSYEMNRNCVRVLVLAVQYFAFISLVTIYTILSA